MSWIHQHVQETQLFLQKYFSGTPQIGIILGSGLGSCISAINQAVRLPFDTIPHFPCAQQPSVPGHARQLIYGYLEGIPIVALQGRLHAYEGYPLRDVIFPTRVLCSLGIHTLILTNAAGAIHPDFKPGDFMLIQDHLNLMGDHPLKGEAFTEQRFLDLSEAYDAQARLIFQQAAHQLSLPLRQGVYAALSGPSYETPAEVRMLRILGADAVGMSTVPECLAARELGIRVVGLSCISNIAVGLSSQKVSHEEVLLASQNASHQLQALLIQALPKLKK